MFAGRIIKYALLHIENRTQYIHCLERYFVPFLWQHFQIWF